MSTADIALGLIGLLTLVLLLTALGSLWVWVPYVPTPMKVVRRMIELAKLQGHEVVYDLGCGDGRILIEAKKRYPAITAIGYELPLAIWLLAKARVFFSRQKVKIFMKDFRFVDLQKADVLFLYLVPEVFRSLGKKLERELKPGTTIISHGFAFPGREPEHVERIPLPSWHLIARTKTKGPRVYVYRW